MSQRIFLLTLVILVQRLADSAAFAFVVPFGLGTRLSSIGTTTRLLRWEPRLSLDDESDTTTTTGKDVRPQIFVSGYSTKPDLIEALYEAVEMALGELPAPSSPLKGSNDDDDDESNNLDLAIVTVSSLYDGGAHQPASVVVPTVIETARAREWSLQNLIGCSVAGCISSRQTDPSSDDGLGSLPTSACDPTELESIPSVSVTFCTLPDVSIKTFFVSVADLPDDYGRFPEKEWKRVVGVAGVGEDAASGTTDEQEQQRTPPVFFVMPSPAFSTSLDDLLRGLCDYFPGSQTVGGVASTVSSLSRAKLYQWNAQTNRGSSSASMVCHTEGCVGAALWGDIQVRSMTAQGAKPVGGIYQILKGQQSTISAIVLDELATEALQLEEEAEEEDDDDEGDVLDAKAQAAKAYAKARIPKPTLAEANFLMRTLSDDDQAFMRRQLLVGLEQGGNLGRTASELARLAQGQGHRFTVHKVASAGMKDGSVTLPLGSVDIKPGTRMRFFVRESDFAKKEIDSLWTGYKKSVLNAQFQSDDTDNKREDQATFTPASCFIVPTLDRGSKFFSGKAGYESSTASRVLPSVPCVAGFFSNGAVCRMDSVAASDDGSRGPASIQGSASGYFLFGSKTGRPIYSSVSAAAQQEALEDQQAAEEAADRALAAEEEQRGMHASSLFKPSSSRSRAPRSDDGELILRRREVNCGRALIVSTVEWSVAEKTASPTSALEGFMWDKETEVDRFRERVPLANLVSQCRLSEADPTVPKPRDWTGSLKQTASDGRFVIVPECKRIEPVTGSLRRRYDLPKLVREFTRSGVAAISVNCDSVLFGGSLEDISKARQVSSTAAVETISEDGVIVPPILASDLILYPYQLYKLRLAGADAVNLIVGAMAGKDLMYLMKIASSLRIQVFATVTSSAQLQSLATMSSASVDGIIVSNRELEDFTFDETGEQALSLLRSKGMQKVRDKYGDELPVLVEGRVGMIGRDDGQGGSSVTKYIEELKEAGAAGAIVGGALASEELDAMESLAKLQAAS